MIPNIQTSSNKFLGSSSSLPAHPSSTAKLTTGQAGGLGQRQHLFLRRFLRSKKRNSAAAETPVVEHFAFTTGQERGRAPKEKLLSLRGKQKFLLFACPVASRRLCYGARPSEFSEISVRPRSICLRHNYGVKFSRKKVRILFRTDTQKQKLPK